MNGTDDIKTSDAATVVHTFKLNWWLYSRPNIYAAMKTLASRTLMCPILFPY
jgi:hypothetical protein